MTFMGGNQVSQRNVGGVVKIFAVTCMLGVAGLLGACGGGESDDDAASATEVTRAPANASEETAADDLTGPAGGGRCVSEYTAQTLQERAFAFDGTVVDVGTESDPLAPSDDIVTGSVQFEVHEWFVGGAGETVTVWMQRSVGEGQRLLVAGEPRWGGAPIEDAIAWECGFTSGYTDDRHQEWSAVFASVDAATSPASETPTRWKRLRAGADGGV